MNREKKEVIIMTQKDSNKIITNQISKDIVAEYKDFILATSKVDDGCWQSLFSRKKLGLRTFQM